VEYVQFFHFDILTMESESPVNLPALTGALHATSLLTNFPMLHTSQQRRIMKLTMPLCSPQFNGRFLLSRKTKCELLCRESDEMNEPSASEALGYNFVYRCYRQTKQGKIGENALFSNT
jgi:hypothetical protein